MAIKDEIAAAFKEARKSRDDDAKRVIQLLRAKMTNELKSGSGAEENDETWLAVLASFAKEARKSIAAYEDVGERGAQNLAEAKYELEFAERFLPKKLGEAETEALVKKIADDQGITAKKDMGRLMGAVMKDHKDEVDGDLVRKAAQKILS